MLKKNSFNIYLKVSIDILENRLNNSKKRPLINKKNLNLTLNELFKKREKFYNRADIIIENQMNVKSAVENIITKIGNYEKN